MRKFYSLTYDDRDDLQSVSGREMAGFSSTIFWTGEPFCGQIPAEVKLFVGKGAPRDYLSNPISWEIVSDRLLAILKEFAQADMQVFPAPLYEKNTGKPLLGYHVVNLTRCIDALAKPWPSAGTKIVKVAQVPSDVHWFRLGGHKTITIVSEELVRELNGKGLQGLAFIKTKSV